MKFNLILPYQTPGADSSLSACETQCIRDPECAVSAFRQQGAEVRVLRHLDSGSKMELELGIHPHKTEVPLPIRTFTGDEGLDYIQKTTYDFKRHHGTMATVMSLPGLRDRVTTKGTFGLSPTVPGHPEGEVTWRIDGEVSVALPFLGGAIEAAIVREVTARSVKVRQHNQSWLDQRSGAGAEGPSTPAE